MSVEGISIGLQGLAPIQTPAPKTKVEGAGAPESFGDVLTQAMKDLNNVQVQADQQIEGLLMQKEGVNVHDAMIALEKADVAFQLMSVVHGKILRAYEEVVRTQI